MISLLSLMSIAIMITNNGFIQLFLRILARGDFSRRLVKRIKVFIESVLPQRSRIAFVFNHIFQASFSRVKLFQQRTHDSTSRSNVSVFIQSHAFPRPPRLHRRPWTHQLGHIRRSRRRRRRSIHARIFVRSHNRRFLTFHAAAAFGTIKPAPVRRDPSPRPHRRPRRRPERVIVHPKPRPPSPDRTFRRRRHRRRHRNPPRLPVPVSPVSILLPGRDRQIPILIRNQRRLHRPAARVAIRRVFRALSRSRRRSNLARRHRVVRHRRSSRETRFVDRPKVNANSPVRVDPIRFVPMNRAAANSFPRPSRSVGRSIRSSRVRARRSRVRASASARRAVRERTPVDVSRRLPCTRKHTFWREKSATLYYTTSKTIYG